LLRWEKPTHHGFGMPTMECAGHGGGGISHIAPSPDNILRRAKSMQKAHAVIEASSLRCRSIELVMSRTCGSDPVPFPTA
jgi:hypothetical protein